MKQVIIVACIAALIASVTYAGSRERVRSLALTPMKIDDGSGSPGVARGGHPQEPPHAASITWVAVDTMANAFGPASRGVKAMAYDSASNVVALIHRGRTTYAQSSGELWYNISRNAGVSWRRVGGLNSGAELLTRYPSCAIANPSNSSDTSNVNFIYGAPQLLAGGATFGRAMWGIDAPLGAGTAFAWQSTEADPSYWSNVHVWGATGNDAVNWVIYRRGTVIYDDLYRWRTTDFITFQEGVPSTWATTNFNSEFGLDIRGEERNGRHYFGKWGAWTGDLNEVYNPGYSVSTDAGTTWSAWTRPQPDFRSIPGIGGSKDWWTYGGAGAYSFDMLVDANNRVHFFGVIEDTLTLQRDVVEIYETGTGWASKMIKSNINRATLLTYNTLNQMGNHLNASANYSGNVMTLIWLDAEPADTSNVPDIWFSYRRITDAAWSTPANLTQTPGYAELLIHAAPTLKRNSATSYTMFLGRSYESGVTTYPPTDVNPTVFYAGTHTFTLTDVGENDENMPSSYSLAQNFPNPFNPATKIDYQVARAGLVTIKVYDILGKEVATVLNEDVQPGSHQVTFDGQKLASGIYVCRMTANGFTQSRKMMLMK